MAPRSSAQALKLQGREATAILYPKGGGSRTSSWSCTSEAGGSQQLTREQPGISHLHFCCTHLPQKTVASKVCTSASLRAT